MAQFTHQHKWRQLEELFSTIAHPTRLRILMLLAQDEGNVRTLAAALGLPDVTISKHLASLREAQIVHFLCDMPKVSYWVDKSDDGTLKLTCGDFVVQIAVNTESGD